MISVRDVIRQEAAVRHAREDVAYHDAEARRCISTRDHGSVRLRAHVARRRLIVALARVVLLPGSESERLIAAVDGWLADARLDAALLDDLARRLDSNDHGGIT